MATYSTKIDILGSFAFIVFWVLAVFPTLPFLPIGRTAGSLLSAALMVIFQVVSPDQAYESLDLSILALLFGTMVVSVYIERADAFKYLSKLLSWKIIGAKDLICRICLVSAITSAFFTNDTACVVLTKFVVKIAQENNLPPLPFLLALASSANIGSAATAIGNPQNFIIASESNMSFCQFLSGMIAATVAGVFANALLILCMFWNLLSVANDENGYTYQFSPNDQENGVQTTSNGRISSEHDLPASRNSNLFSKWKGKFQKTCVYLIVLGMLIALLAGQDMSWTAITAALALVVLDFKDAAPCFDKVSYSLLVFFCGMFITVEGLDKTGIPSLLWDSVEKYTSIDTASGVAVVSLAILLLSNLISNVPTVLLLGCRMATAAAMVSPGNEKKAWLILAWVSTVAGNLSLLGSAANLVVCEQAHRAALPPLGYTLTFGNHLKFGLPSTLIVTAIGLTIIK